MSSDLRRFGDEVWDRFFDFVLSCDKNLSQTEVQAELKHRNISTAAAFTRIKESLEKIRAREALAKARVARASASSRVKSQSTQPFGGLRESLQAIIGKLTGQEQAAYFHKLEKAATEEDLRSLLDDLHRLDEFDIGSDDGSE